MRDHVRLDSAPLTRPCSPHRNRAAIQAKDENYLPLPNEETYQVLMDGWERLGLMDEMAERQRGYRPILSLQEDVWSIGTHAHVRAGLEWTRNHRRGESNGQSVCPPRCGMSNLPTRVFRNRPYRLTGSCRRRSGWNQTAGYHPYHQLGPTTSRLPLTSKS
eukprot:2255089-Rhodomonas_salina.2